MLFIIYARKDHELASRLAIHKTGMKALASLLQLERVFSNGNFRKAPTCH